jgi:hypothetical protein
MQPPPQLSLPSAFDIHPLIEAKLDQVQGLLNCSFFCHQAGSAAVALLLLPAWLLHTTYWLPPTQEQVLPEVLPASATPGMMIGRAGSGIGSQGRSPVVKRTLSRPGSL